MSKSGQAYIAATLGTSFTLYAACKAMGMSLSPEQEEFQEYLEAHYPAVVNQEYPKEEDNGTARTKKVN